MNINTESDNLGVDLKHPWSKHFTIIKYKDGGLSNIPHGFFRNWLDEEVQGFNFYIGRCSGFGVGSTVKYDSGHQSLRVGRFVAGGLRLRFLLNGQHESRSISTYMFSIMGSDFFNPPPPQYTDSVIKNDIWIGDDVMMLGGGIVENGCIVGARSLLPPNFRSEAYGIYVGSPARLVRFRFSEKIREALLGIDWWNRSLSWILQNNNVFLMDLTKDEGRVLEVLAELKEKR